MADESEDMAKVMGFANFGGIYDTVLDIVTKWFWNLFYFIVSL